MNKRITFKNATSQELVGYLWSADTDAVVIMAHGSGSNQLARGLFPAIAQAIHQAGYAAMTFDFSGHGESDDAVTTLQDYVDDVKAAIDYAKGLGYKKIVLVGHSLGAYACLMNYSAAITTMILIGALAGPVAWYWQNVCTPEQLKELETVGYVTAQVDDGFRKGVMLAGNLLDDIRAIDQEELIRRVHCPLLFIHGDGDQEELDLLAVSRTALEFAQSGSDLKLLPGANHIFENRYDEVVQLVVDWVKEHVCL